MDRHQIHKRLTTEQVTVILAKYCTRQLTAKEAIAFLGLKKTRFYEVVQRYRKDPHTFSINYARKSPSRFLDAKTEEHIIAELKVEKEKIIDNPDVPTKHYNYSYIRNRIEEEYGETPAVSTIITRAKQHGYYTPRPPKKLHDREVITNYSGELVQHDSSHHLFAPDARQKWYLIDSIDDHSRLILFAQFFLEETSLAHIFALERVFLNYGVPLAYYADNHRIFRYVKDRDVHTLHTNYTKFTDDVDPQWKQVLRECGVETKYALSPQAKGKIERPYRWMQDHLVRACVREHVTDVAQGNELLRNEVDAYNARRVHSTTGEIPLMRYEHAKNTNQSLFREFTIPKPFASHRDIFALRETRKVSQYRTISLHGSTLKISGVSPEQEVLLRLYPHRDTGIMEVRIWHKDSFKGAQNVKISDLKTVRF